LQWADNEKIFQFWEALDNTWKLRTRDLLDEDQYNVSWTTFIENLRRMEQMDVALPVNHSNNTNTSTTPRGGSRNSTTPAANADDSQS
jgi:hypothetical protein